MSTAQKLTLNQGQNEAAEGFFGFLFNEDEKEIIISGPGGVGKTHLLGHMIDDIMPRYYDTCKLMGILPEFDDVEMTATTNKAAEALSLSSGRPVKTIHSLMSLKPSNDHETGRSKIEKTGGWTVHQRKIIFVDECSMIDSPLYAAIHEGTHGCKIVYVGDHCQMAPVMEPISPIYRMGLKQYELTQPMRNSGQPALMALCQQLRNTVETGEFLPIYCVPGVIDHLTPQEMQAELDVAFLSQDHDNRILAYTNRQVVNFNEYIREIRGLDAEFQTGERLISSTAVQFKDRMMRVEEEVTILDQAGKTEHVQITPETSLEIRKTTLRSSLGHIYKDAQIPVDRNHFDNLLRWLKERKNWGRFFFLKEKFPDLRQRDASTVYKAQGSTLNTVYIDVENISSCTNADQAARMLYVAVSRPRTRIVFYGKLAEKYGGIIK